VASAQEWARIGHSLAHRAAAVRSGHDAICVINVGDSTRYVQWHAEDGEAIYLEAASGLYSGDELSPQQQRILQQLGWDAPGQGWGKDQVLNWSRLFESPVDLYQVVRMTVATLRDVFGAEPQSLCVDPE
jgi:hypothetical protein